MTDPAASAFPPPGSFTAETLLRCYAQGVFPMGEARDDPRVFLVEPELRGVIPLDGFHIPTRLRRTVRAEPFVVRGNTVFPAVLDACAAPSPGREDTWINGPIRRLYLQLHAMGHAHSLECWRDEELVGGLYGVTLGGAFFGESMFSRVTDASKVAMVHLVARLRRGGWRLLDAQFRTPHLDQFGLIEIPQSAYLERLATALETTLDPAGLSAPLSGLDAVSYALQPTIHAS
ncbi:leucyl/phenylalanyl-tRNA--protein transferase [Brevundimonas subvibrioides]|uniref:Leucyl/phenylalanyl-tRNA--protein transferase n=1 Tax=Brevundimonas subvibrioides (strain ATCC 15264 / DSM 4735 / LMG 14903 / NBRC 16000 / CB 81) TaxID=633149 RepID=D9QJF3_BRESC|nr:leucyl/phenylalanyl-tRNA--protein transferase [Brevundimonas subvibrioides]ADL01514.1 leucyl/phenylalanyl-tRNA/protein transferase [Brevundimonas subvibrioides ATCC 15264]